LPFTFSLSSDHKLFRLVCMQDESYLVLIINSICLVLGITGCCACSLGVKAYYVACDGLKAVCLVIVVNNEIIVGNCCYHWIIERGNACLGSCVLCILGECNSYRLEAYE
jgi:hypothetical protein